MAKLKLVSFKLCPFVQRSIITLQEKGADYEIEYIDLSNKPQWFLDISPFGKVPVLQVGDTVLFESAVINEYLDETLGDRLHPTDPLERAHNRAWIEYVSSLLGDQYRLMMAPDEASATELAGGLTEKLGRIQRQLEGGPYFRGQPFSLVDAASAPLLQRMGWIEEIAPELDITGPLPEIRAWTEALLERPSVQNSTVEDIKELALEMIRRPRGDANEPGWLGRRSL